MNLVESDAGIHFDPVQHKYVNSAGERYVSGTQFIGFFKPKFERDFWLTVKSFEDYFDKFPINNPELNKLNEWRHNAGWKDISKFKLQQFTLWKFIKTMKMNKVSNDTIIQYCHRKADELGIQFDLELSKKTLAKEWDQKSDTALEKGTAYHDGEEQKIRKAFGFTHDWNNIDLSYPNLTKGMYPELRLYNHEYQIAGSADKTLIHKGGLFHMQDFKTNEKLEMESFENPYTKEKEKMLDPISELDNCSFIHYTLQLSLYSWMLEQLGYKWRKSTILHIQFFKDTLPGNEGISRTRTVPIPTLYLKKAILRMLEYYMDNNLRPY